MNNVNLKTGLSEAQINYLFQFVEKKFVKWYDLQIEIVDHLASGIENEMSIAPTLSFESALQKVYNSFGIFGFANIVKERQNYLVQSAKKRWWKEIKSLFKWPGMITLILVLTVVITISSLLKPGAFANAYFVISIVTMLPTITYIAIQKSLKKPLLLMQFGATYIPLVWMFQLFTITGSGNMSQVLFIILSTVAVMVGFVTFQLYRKVRQEAKAIYPAVFKK